MSIFEDAWPRLRLVKMPPLFGGSGVAPDRRALSPPSLSNDAHHRAPRPVIRANR